MKRSALLLAGAVSAAALSTSFALVNVTLAQEAPVTESVADPVAEKAAVANEKPEAETAANVVAAEPKAAAKAQEVEKTAAADAKQAVAVEAEPKVQEEAATTSAGDTTPSVRQIVIEPKAIKDANAEADKAAETADKAAAVEEGKAEPVAEKAAVADKNRQTETLTNAVVAEPKAPAVAEKVEETAAIDARKPTATKSDVVPEEKAAAPVKRSPGEIVLALQTELKRVGCYNGAVDGVWGAYSEEALEAFRYFGQIDHDDVEPSETWIAHVKGATKTICRADQYGDTYPSQHQGYNHGYHQPSYDGYRGSYPGGSSYRY